MATTILNSAFLSISYPSKSKINFCPVDDAATATNVGNLAVAINSIQTEALSEMNKVQVYDLQ